MDTIENRINMILSRWNPIDVLGNVAEAEYKSYVDRIISKSDNLEMIINTLEQILMQDIGLSYNPDNITQKNDVSNVANEIFITLKPLHAICMFCGSSLIMKSKHAAELVIWYGATEESQDSFAHIKCLKEKVINEFPILLDED